MHAALSHDRVQRALVGLVTLFPALAVGSLIVRYTVDVPYWDEWELAPLLLRSLDGPLSFSDVWQQHNEHRPLVARSVMLALARATHWSVPAELALIFGLFVAAFAQLAVVLRRGGSLLPRPLWLLPAMSLVFFSPSQWENWLWGWQIMLALQYAASIAALATLAAASRTTLRVALAAMFAAVSTFSFATGLVVWAVGLLPLADDVARRRDGACPRASLWLAIGATCVAAYFRGYAANPHHPSVLATLGSGAELWRLARFVLVFLASPLVDPGSRAATWSGLGLCATLAALTANAARWRGDDVGRSRLWLATLLGLYALGNAVLIGLGRAEFGGVPSRYVTLATPLALAVMIGLAQVLSGSLPRRSPVGPLRPWLRLAVVLLVLGSLTGWVEGPRAFSRRHEQLSRAREALLSGVDDLDRLAPLYLVPGLLIQWRPALERHRLGPFREGHADP